MMVQSPPSRDVLDKLGVYRGQAVSVVGRGDPQLLRRVHQRIGRPLAKEGFRADLILFWPQKPSDVSTRLRALRTSIFPEGAIWVITPKKGRRGCNGMPYLEEAQLIPLGLTAGLVDNKICSISETESARRFVWRRKDRSREGRKANGK